MWQEMRVSGIPNTIPKLGDAQLKPRQNPEFVPGSDFGTEDYYVWSRCDGSASLHDIILMVGFGTDRSITILSKLRNMGAILMPGEKRAPVVQVTFQPAPKRKPAPKPSPTAEAAPNKGKGEPTKQKAAPTPASNASAPKPAPKPKAAPKPKPSPKLSKPSAEEEEALGLTLPLPHDERVRILMYRRQLGQATLFELLEIEAEEADKRSIKRAYYRLSKEFHPDRYYGEELGPFGGWLAEVFKAVTDAFNVLGDNKKRARYEADLRGDAGGQKPQTKQEHAHALFLNACDAELHGESEQALKYFAASIRMDEQARVLRRAAMCAVQARELSVAEDYAKKAAHLCANDASYLRTLADVYRAGRRLEEAHQVLLQALKLDTESDVLFTELKADLASVQASIAELEAQAQE